MESRIKKFTPHCVCRPGTAFTDVKQFISQVSSRGVGAMEMVAMDMKVRGMDNDQTASASHLDLDRAPYVLYGVKYIDLVSL